MFKLIALAATSILLVGCGGTKSVYNNNGLNLVQVTTDPGLFHQSYNVLVKEENGESSVVTITSNGSLTEQAAAPISGIISSGIIADAIKNSGDVTNNNNSNNNTAEGGAGGKGGKGGRGGNSSATSTNTNVNANSNENSNANVNANSNENSNANANANSNENNNANVNNNAN